MELVSSLASRSVSSLRDDHISHTNVTKSNAKLFSTARRQATDDASGAAVYFVASSLQRRFINNSRQVSPILIFPTNERENVSTQNETCAVFAS
jgi:hypothetical protein